MQLPTAEKCTEIDLGMGAQQLIGEHRWRECIGLGFDLVQQGHAPASQLLERQTFRRVKPNAHCDVAQDAQNLPILHSSLMHLDQSRTNAGIVSDACNRVPKRWKDLVVPVLRITEGAFSLERWARAIKPQNTTAGLADEWAPGIKGRNRQAEGLGKRILRNKLPKQFRIGPTNKDWFQHGPVELPR